MKWTKIFEKGSKIVNVGVSLELCGPTRAIAFLEDGEKESAKAHMALCQTSEYYAKYEDIAIIEATSVGCGHWNQFLACIVDEVPVPPLYQDKLCEPGRPYLDKARLVRDNPALKTLTDLGLQCTCTRPSIYKEFPKLPKRAAESFKHRAPHR